MSKWLASQDAIVLLAFRCNDCSMAGVTAPQTAHAPTQALFEGATLTFPSVCRKIKTDRQASRTRIRPTSLHWSVSQHALN